MNLQRTYQMPSLTAEKVLEKYDKNNFHEPTNLYASSNPNRKTNTAPLKHLNPKTSARPSSYHLVYKIIPGKGIVSIDYEYSNLKGNFFEQNA